jgi:hypothetical protein
VSVSEHERRLKDGEEKISETRKTVSNLERMLAIMNADIGLRLKGIEGNFATMKHLVIVAAIGIGGLIGMRIWDKVFPVVPDSYAHSFEHRMP